MPTETMPLRAHRSYAVKDDEGRPVMIGRVIHRAPQRLCSCRSSRTNRLRCCRAVALTRHAVIAYHEVGRGTLDAVLVTQREVFKAAILGNAAAVIVGHSHPSGDPTPSSDDFELTSRLTAAGVLLGIEVLDHIVVGDGRYVSFKEIGLL